MNDGIASRFYEKRHVDKLKMKIKLLGINYDPYLLIAIKFVSSLILFILLLVVFKLGYIIAPILTIIFYLFSEYLFIDLKIKKRREKLECEALDFFPIFLLSLDGERSIKKSIMLTTSIVKNSLAEEFVKVLTDIDVGKSLEEALIDLEKRIPSDAINNIILSIREANKLGNSVTESIDLQLDYINARKKVNYMTKLKKDSIILTIISVIFFALMLLILVVFNSL